MFAAQLFAAARKQLGNLDRQFARGEFAPLKEWLNTQIHHRGMQYSSQELVRIVTGESLSHVPLIRHLREKYAEIYGLSP